MNRRLFTSVLFACLLPFMVQAQQAVFRFAQLTDIHLSPNNPNPTEDLLRSIAQINATDSIDFVLVTGDIAEEGDRATMEKVKSCLDLLKVKYYVVLGNHVPPSERYSVANGLNSNTKVFCSSVLIQAR